MRFAGWWRADISKPTVFNGGSLRLSTGEPALADGTISRVRERAHFLLLWLIEWGLVGNPEVAGHDMGVLHLLSLDQVFDR